jgi:ribonuclease P protein component
MKKKNRLTKAYQFQQARAKGKSWSHPLLVLVVVPNKLDITRCGFATGKRLGKAHVRNRLKRMLREAVRVRHSGLKKGYDLVWIGRNSLTEDIDFWKLDAVVENLLRRAKLIQYLPPQVAQRAPKTRPEPGQPESS